MPCRKEAVSLDAKAADFRDWSGVAGFSYVLGLMEDQQGKPPTAADSAAYAEALGLKGFPVTADIQQKLIPDTPWDGTSRPGKCVLTPTMKMLKCYTGEDDTEAFQAIYADADGK